MSPIQKALDAAGVTAINVIYDNRFFTVLPNERYEKIWTYGPKAVIDIVNGQMRSISSLEAAMILVKDGNTSHHLELHLAFGVSQISVARWIEEIYVSSEHLTESFRKQ